jgi:hypothetical protein
MTKDNWPKRPDGSNKTVGEMTPAEKREQFAKAAKRVQAEFEDPAMQKAVGDYLADRTH